MSYSEIYLSYPIAVFTVVLLTGCVLNLIKQHYIFQLSGIAFFFTFFTFRTMKLIHGSMELPLKEIMLTSLPAFSGVSACLVSMVLGFWVFPPIRKKFKA